MVHAIIMNTLNQARRGAERRDERRGGLYRDADSASARLKELRRTWKAPPELQRCRPREVRLTGAGRALVVLACFLFAGAAALAIVLQSKASRDREERLRIEREGAPAQGRVTRRWIRGNDKKRYFVGFEFRAEGRPYAGSVEVGRRGYGRFAEESPIPVRYLPSDPDRHLVPGYEDKLLPLWLPLPLGLLVAAGGLACLSTIASGRRLLAHGRAAPAIVTRVERKKGSEKVGHYTFLKLSGAPVEGRTGDTRKPPEPGTVICVVYEPDRERRSAIYPFTLVRVARGGR